MKSLTLVILLTICASSYGLKCAITEDGLDLEESLIGLTSADLLKQIKGLKTEEYDHNECRIEVSVSYDKKLLFVKFTEHLQESRLKDELVQIDTIIDGIDADDISARHYIEYSCPEDLCEVEFVEKYSEFLDWVLHARYSELPDKLASSIFGDGEDKGECFNDGMNVTEACDSGHCAARFSTKNDEYYPIEQSCVDTDKTKLTGFHITLYFDISFSNIETDLLFICTYNKCNDKDKANEVESKFFEFYDKEAIFEMFGKETTTRSTESVTSSTAVTTTNEAHNALYVRSTNTIIYITLIILISYWFLLA